MPTGTDEAEHRHSNFYDTRVNLLVRPPRRLLRASPCLKRQDSVPVSIK